MEDVLVQFDKEVVLPHLALALKSSVASVRYWNAQMVALFPSSQLIGLLSDLLKDGYDTQAAAIMTLTQIEHPYAKADLQRRLEIQTDPEFRELLEVGLSYVGDIRIRAR